MSERIDAMRVIADWVEQFGWTAYYNQKIIVGFLFFIVKEQDLNLIF